jgi:hypothetical protein
MTMQFGTWYDELIWKLMLVVWNPYCNVSGQKYHPQITQIAQNEPPRIK